MRYALLIGLVTSMFVLCTAEPANAVLQYYKVFKTEYLDTHTDKKFAAEVDKGANKCYRMTMTARDGSQLTAFFKAK